MLPAAFLTAFLLIPLGTLARQFLDPAAVADLVDGRTWQITGLAALQASASTCLALVVGIPIAGVVSRYRFRGRALAQALVTVPFVLPTVVVALAFRSVLGPGLPQGLLLVIVAHAYINLAVVVRIVGAHWAQQDQRMGYVARTLGASPWRAFTSVTIPALRAPIASAAAVVFVFSFTSLGIALLLGDSTTRTLESQILRQTSVLLDFPGAAATAVIQLLLVSLILIAALLVSRRGPRQQLAPPHLLPLPAHLAGRVAIWGLAGLVYLIVLAPVASLVITSLASNGHLTLRWWESLGSIDAGTTRIGSPLAAMATSLGFAVVAGLTASIVGGAAAIALLAGRVGRIIAVLAIIPLGVSAATLGLGTVLAFGRPPMDLRGTGLLVPLAHALVAVPIVVAVVAPALRSTDGRAHIVAATLGARPTRAFLTAYGPVLRVVMLAAGGLAAAVSLGEFGAASFLARAGNPTMPLVIARLLGRPGEQSYGVAAAMAVILVALTLTMVLAVDRLGVH